MSVKITYRGSLSSCNYECTYCPFAKTINNSKQLKQDENELLRFIEWIESQEGKHSFEILFTPWGEGLVRKWYRDGLVKLSHMNHVKKVVIQTNLSTIPTWTESANRESLALWTTFHPTETTIEKFLSNINVLNKSMIPHSVGIVGTKENKTYAQLLRSKLPSHTYLWVNAYKDEENYYPTEDIDFFTKIDPLFSINNTNYPSLNRECSAGIHSISVNGDGIVTKCHFVKNSIGNIYEDNLHTILSDKRLCPNSFCNCYIGYIHLPSLALADTYGDKLLERIPIVYQE